MAIRDLTISDFQKQTKFTGDYCVMFSAVGEPVPSTLESSINATDVTINVNNTFAEVRQSQCASGVLVLSAKDIVQQDVGASLTTTDINAASMNFAFGGEYDDDVTVGSLASATSITFDGTPPPQFAITFFQANKNGSYNFIHLPRAQAGEASFGGGGTEYKTLTIPINALIFETSDAPIAYFENP